MDEYILDACALIAYYTNEKGADVVQDIIGKAYFEKGNVSISNINLLEVFYDVYKIQGEQEAKDFLQDIVNSPIRIIETIEKQAFIEAGRLKASYRISLADSIFLAEILTNEKCIGITADHHEFDIVKEKENINLLFIR
ncbi:MAG: PIN domain-containing protein [Fibromonadaceae bacterium]|jgi:PIN domain nuclease of toxin-antitoxin system|nr:PIN domain-containing protein [Fibromonadaceae bacterium]